MPLFPLPDPGEGLVEAEIVTWKVKKGDEVTTNDVVVEVETAKSLVELPIPYDGVVRELLVAEGDVVEVGTAIIDIDDGGAGNAETPQSRELASDRSTDPQRAEPDGDTAQVSRPDDLVPEVADDPSARGASTAREANLVGYGPSVGSTTRRRRKSSTDGSSTGSGSGDARPRPKAKPPVRKYAKDRGVDLAAVRATGEDGVVTRADIDAHRQETQPSEDALSADATPSPSAVAGSTDARETRVPVKGVRKMTANAMVDSAFTAPHVTEFIAVDVSATMELVQRLKDDRHFRDVKVSPLLVLAKALVVAVRRHPDLNAVWDGVTGEIVQRHYVNLGIAAATPRGLIVPNIKDAHEMDLHQLAEALQELVETARAGRTQPAHMSGGTITITNVGVFGVDTGTPIINPGESAIVCFGAVQRRPWVVTSDGVERIEPRWVTELSMSFDHRLVDGELGSRFLADLAALLHDPALALVWG